MCNDRQLSPTPAEALPSPAQRRHATVVALTVVVGTVMVPIDVTVMAVALAPLAEQFDTALPVIQWVVTAYTVALAATVPTAAWVIDQVGARRAFLLAVGAFTVGSLAAALAWDLASLVAARAVQGAGAGLVTPAAMSLALGAAAPGDRGRVSSLLGLPILVGPAVGPVLGGLAMDGLSWRWLFLAHIPVGALALWVGRRNLAPDRATRGRRLDVRGLCLLPPAMVLTVGAGAAVGDAGLLAASFGVGSVVLMAIFVRHALRHPAPLVDVGLLSQRRVGVGAGLLVLYTGGYFATLVLVPLHWQVATGASATSAGLLMVPLGIVSGLTIQVSGRLTDRLPAPWIIRTGIGLTVLGYLGYVSLLGPHVSAPAVVATLVIVAVGAGSTAAPTIAHATRWLAPAELPAGSTLITVGRQVSTALTTALVAATFATQLGGPPSSDAAADGRGVTALAGTAAAHDAMQVTFVVPLTLMVGAWVVAFFLPRR